MDVIRGLGEVGEGSHQVAGVEAESHPEVAGEVGVVQILPQLPKQEENKYILHVI